MAELFTNIMQAIIFLGLIVLGVLMKRWIDALKGTVAAQSQTITSQKTLLENLGNVLNAADTPKMLERVEAYKKFVDQEKEAAIQDLERKFAEERKELVRAGVETTSELADDFIALIVNLMPYVPREDRKALIESTNFSKRAKSFLWSAADKLADFSFVYVRFSQVVPPPLPLVDQGKK